MKVRVRLFAVYREALRRSEVDVELPEGSTVEHAFDRLFSPADRERLPRRSTRFAVNQEFCSADSTLHDGDEVAFIPPVAGGSR